MKILILSFYYTPDLCAGSFRTAALINALKKQISPNDHIEIITTHPNRYNTFKKQAEECEEEGNVKIFRIKLPSHKSGMFDQAKAFWCYFKHTRKLVRKKKYDLIFATSSRLFTAFMGAYISSKKNIRLFLDIRDLFSDTLKSLFKGKIQGKLFPFFLLRFIEVFTFRKADKINLVSEGFVPYFNDLVGKKDYLLYPNGIDDVFLNRNYSKTEKNKVLRITYAGNIGEGQGLHKLIPTAAKRLEGKAEFIIIGDGGCRKILENQINCLGLSNVRLFQPVPQKELLNYYADTDILLLHLNDYEAFKKVLPSKIFEYAATEKPILAGVGGFAKEFIKSNIENAVIFTPTDVNDFINSIDKISLNSNKREAFINKFKRTSTMNKLAQEILSTIEI